jgi:hypothetical protein
MQVVLIQSGRAAVMGKLDLDLHLVLRDGEFTHRARSPFTKTAPRAIRRAAWQIPPFQRQAGLFRAGGTQS